MNDSVSILVAVFIILVILRWMLGGNQSNQTQQRPNQRQATRRPQHRVTPQMIEMVRAMFPDIPVAAIQADLQRTGSVETTVDNALRDGSLPLPPSASPTITTTTTTTTNNQPSSSSTGRNSPNHANLVQRYKIDVDHVSEAQEPPKVWETNPDKRQEMLKKRKEYMVLQARKRMMEQANKQKKIEQESVSNNNGSNNVSNNDSKTFDEMSVDELNSLSAEQRRQQMLQALNRRNSEKNIFQ
ncbi:hypothetical protein BCV72DRAFT_309535 [Rhizopus microsporus var. microsporus]|uniref:CUE domain-containing protein n=2 Tax=Rhizopus microsporus TaxID=58291 RepID=A0A2G4SZZ7_RHIZD|nr:uncharacterized protein RHIMIDRAFT_117157 [Rhizopus microsporus ATCC 52813]ORE01992.1 hypothetical protein BCV72DRAFT_309535 [Rhizopus microsporus var. microsporus]PHZ14340.1 hypothetical protein RHIMIDRAFT_117157 [Rhizopus microsporus ATCC 52813]